MTSNSSPDRTTSFTVTRPPQSIRSGTGFTTSQYPGPAHSEQVALTTWWTPPASCSTRTYNVGAPLYYEIMPSYGTWTSDCYPSATWQFSPGLCPDGYYVAETLSDVISYTDVSVLQTLTKCFCCPSQLTYRPTQCVSEIIHPGETTVVIVMPDSQSTTSVLPVTTASTISYVLWTFSSNSEFSANTSTTIGPGETLTLQGGVISAFYEATDIAISSTWSSLFAERQVEFDRQQSEYAAYLTARAAGDLFSSVAIVRSSEVAGTDRASGSTSTNEGGLSGGAIAGVAVGAVMFLVLVLGGTLLLLRRRKQREQHPAIPEDMGYSKPELDSIMVLPKELHDDAEVKELDTHATPAVELSQPHLVELPVGDVELPADASNTPPQRPS